MSLKIHIFVKLCKTNNSTTNNIIMKIKHLLIGLFAVAATVACDQEEPVETPSLEVSQETLALDAKEDEASFDVTSNLAWTATADETWVHLEPSSADASKDPVTVTVTADDNTAEEARTAVITVKAGELTKTIELTQAAAEAEDPGDEPGDESEITELYLLGEACDTGWDLNRMAAFELVDGLWTWTGNLKPDDGEGEAEVFRFPLQKVPGAFWPCLVPNADGTAVTYAEDEVENTYTVETDGNYKITINPENLAMTIERLGDRVVPEFTVTELYMLGGACDTGWTLADMTAFENNNGVFTWTGHLKANEEFRFPLQKIPDPAMWWPCYMISADGQSLVLGQKDEDKVVYKVAQSGIYTITINLTNLENPTVSIELVEEDVVPVWGIVGSWDEWAAAQPMSVEGEYHVIKGVEFTAETAFKFRYGDSWDDANVIGAAGEVVVDNACVGGHPGTDIKPGVAGTYDIYLDVEGLRFYIMTEGKTPADAVVPTLSKVVVYCAKFSEFDNSNLYTYNPEFAKWPGLVGELVEVEGAEYYKWEIDGVELGGSWNAVFTNADGSVQTVDVTGLTFSEEQWFVVSTEQSNGKYLANQVDGPEVVVPEPENPNYQVSELYMLGGACDTGWGINEMTAFENVNGLWVWEGNLKPGGDNEAFRFPLQKVENGWWPCLVPNADGTAVILGTADGVNTYRVPSDGYYRVTVDPVTGALTIERLSDRVNPTIEVTELYMLGAACSTSWDLNAMEAFTNDNGVFTWTGELKAEEKFRFPLQKVENVWWPCLMISADGTQLVYGVGDADEVIYHVAETAEYTITVDVRDWHNRTVSIVKNEPEVPAGPKVVTVAEFLAAEEDATEYQLTGVMEGTYNQTYGNFYLNDGTGKVCVYGLTATKQTSNDKSFASLGLRDGDTVTLIGIRTNYQGTPQVGGPAYYVSHVAAPYLEIGSPIATVEAGATTCSVELSANIAWTATTSEGVELSSYSGEGDATVILTFGANTAADAVVRTVTFSAEGLSKTFTVTQKGTSAAVGGGRADLETLTNSTNYGSHETTSGWSGTNCAVFEGGESNSSPKFTVLGKVAGTNTYAKALCMNGKTTAVGTIESPELTGGCGVLSFNYALVFSDKSGVNFRVDIIQNEEVTKTFTVTNASLTQHTLGTHEETVNVEGAFKVKFTNLSPSNTSGSNKDRTCVFNIAWTGYAN